MEGQLLDGRYRCLARIGSGGMGDVWRCRDERIGRDVAVKLLPYAANSGGTPDRFEREARIVGTLASPAIVTVHDYGQTEVGGRLTPYLVMELLDGTALNTRLMTGEPVPIADVAAWGSAVCVALEHAHARGVVHRDIKPANVFLCADGSVKVLDFGIARLVEPDAAGHTPMTVSGMILGTPHYMSPEQAGGQKADHRSDLYSLGCLLYALVDGQPPFHAESMYGIAMQHLTAQPSPPGQERPDLPSDLRRLILDLLAKSPEDRPQSAEEVRGRLTALAVTPVTTPVANGSAPASPPPPPTAPPPTLITREPATRGGRFVVAAVAAAVALALAIVLAVQWQGDDTGTKGKAGGAGPANASKTPTAGPSTTSSAKSDPAVNPGAGQTGAVPATIDEAGTRESTAPLMARIRAADPCAMLDREFPKRFGPVVVETARKAQDFTECQILASNGGPTDLSVRFRVKLGVPLTAAERAKTTPATENGVALFEQPAPATANTCTVVLPFGDTGFGAEVYVNQHYPNKGSDQAPWAEGCATARAYAALVAPKVSALAPRGTAPAGRTLVGKDPCNDIDLSTLKAEGWLYQGVTRDLPYRCEALMVNGDSEYTVSITFERDAEQVAESATPLSVRGMKGILLPGNDRASFCIASLTYLPQTSSTAWDAHLISVHVDRKSDKGGATLDTCTLAETAYNVVTAALGS
ncbi:serine/threonine-protein kinase [Yinghuangia soli]|uniref:non-specific serine/threonine protein kinase n=1 Tax=Yinghuangia soli TaxID=2908204 RepID=A0AA41U8Y4_9ACTN|nr:serine/threonine-protein kinase [Yinghuangia soli]MCF2533354.1 serine/threonine protein kinase [Yinghuangia soli]